MSKRILITGARAPVALELARHFARHGHQSFVADSVRCPMSRASRYVEKGFVLPPPRTDLAGFGRELVKLIDSQKIDLLIPTCEEVFFISWHLSELRKHCSVFCDEFSKLKSVHSKWTFLDIARECGASIPASHLLKSSEDLERLAIDPKTLVFKPEFSRFASFTQVSPEPSQMKNIKPSEDVPWVAQARIAGKEFCSYSVAQNGILKAHACYHPAYRVGLGSGVYFEPVRHKKILDFVTNFVSKTKYHGQVGFDFIETPEGEVFVLECNPRATSGAHLFSDTDDLSIAFLDRNASMIEAFPERARMVAPAVVLFNFTEQIQRKGFRKLLGKFSNAQDVCFTIKDPLPSFYQFVGLGEVVVRSMVKRVGLKEAATADIEWNGEALR